MLNFNPSPNKSHIVVSGDEIADVVSGDPRQTAITEKIDLDGKFIVPGLWDVHTHIGKGIPDSEARDETSAERTIRAGENCLKSLRMGITSLRLSLIHI